MKCEHMCLLLSQLNLIIIPTSIPHFLFTCEIYRLDTFMPALCSDTYFFISSYVALVSADVISTLTISIVTFNVIIRLLFQLGQKNNRFYMGRDNALNVHSKREQITPLVMREHINTLLTE